MKTKILFVSVVFLIFACGLPAFESNGTEAAALGALTSTVTPSPTLAMAPTNISEVDVKFCWLNGYAEMTIDNKLVRVSVDGFTYTARKGIIMSRENITLNVDYVVVRFVTSGVGDSLEVVVEYHSSVVASFKLGDAGKCLWLSAK